LGDPLAVPPQAGPVPHSGVSAREDVAGDGRGDSPQVARNGRGNRRGLPDIYSTEFSTEPYL